MRLKSTIVLALSAAVLLISGITRSGLAQPVAGRRSTPDLYQLYGEFTGKTVLRPGALPPLLLPETEGDVSTTQPDRIKQIEAVFADAKLDVIPDGNRFVWIMPAGLSNSSMMKLLKKIPRPSRTVESGQMAKSNPAGAITLINSPVEQVLRVYSDLRRRTLLRPAGLPAPQISLQSQTPLTREEVVYALNVVLLFNGLATIDDGEKFVQVVPARMAAQVETGSPAPNADEPLIDPTKVPRIGFPERGVQRSDPPIAATLLAFYAELTDQKPWPEQKLGGVPVIFEVKTPLGKSELLYAIKTTLTLNGLKIIAEGEQVRLERIAR